MPLRVPVVAILGLAVSCGVELWLLGHAVGMSRRNARAIETTATVVSEPAYGTAKVSPGFLNRKVGYWFDYEYVVDGKAYRGHGMESAPPSGTAAVWYDSDDPAQSRTELERTGAAWFLVALGGAACIAAAAKAWSQRGS